MLWGHFLAPKNWSCKSDINLRPNFDRQIAEKRMQKKILRKKCKILPTIRSAAVALRCETCLIFISVTEFREFYILQLLLSQDFNQSSPWFQPGGRQWMVLVVDKCGVLASHWSWFEEERKGKLLEFWRNPKRCKSAQERCSRLLWENKQTVKAPLYIYIYAMQCAHT